MKTQAFSNAVKVYEFGAKSMIKLIYIFRKRPQTKPINRSKTPSPRAVFKTDGGSENVKHSNASTNKVNKTRPEGGGEGGSEGCTLSSCRGTSRCPVRDEECRLLKTHEGAVSKERGFK